MTYTNVIATMSTDIITNEGILDLFKNARWENLLFFVLLAAVLVFGGRYVFAKPKEDIQKEQNQILKDFSSSLEKLVVNNATEETSRDERHLRYLFEIDNVRQLIVNRFNKTDRDLKEINDTLIRHNATRCGYDRVIKEVNYEKTGE